MGVSEDGLEEDRLDPDPEQQRTAGRAIQMAAGSTGPGKTELLPVRFLTPFDPDQVSAFCRNWHSQYVAQDRQKRFSDLLERLKLNDGLARLARIPVLLNIICFIHARRGRLPDGRAELYRRIEETYLTALDTARGIRFRDRALQFDYYELHSWLGQIALEIQQGRGGGEDGKDTVVIGRARVEEIFMPVLEEAHEAGETWPAFYAWAVLAGVVMDTAIRIRPRMRRDYIKLLWRFVLIGNAQVSWRGMALLVEHLWSEQQDSLAEFARQAADIKRLRLNGRAIVDLAPLTGLVNLIGLIVFDSPISDLTPLSRLVNLESLYLSGTEVNEVTPLSGLVKLERLGLMNTKVNDVTPLSRLVNLKTLDLRATKVSESDMLELREKLKDTVIIH
jgi:hypothetical protein